MISSKLFSGSQTIAVIVIRCLHRTHYEILNLNRNCSPQDVKNSFIKLSKTQHPDKNQTSGSHDNYVRIVEAYSVLSKPQSRAEYDISLTRNDIGSSRYSSRGPASAYNSRPIYRPVNRHWNAGMPDWKSYQQTYNNNPESNFREHGNRAATFVLTIVGFWFLLIFAFMQYRLQSALNEKQQKLDELRAAKKRLGSQL